MTVPDADELLERTGFDAKESILTRRQAEVLVLREADIPQADIAEELDRARGDLDRHVDPGLPHVDGLEGVGPLAFDP